jgi:hypothetical protein
MRERGNSFSGPLIVVDNGLVGFLIVPFCRLHVADGLMLVVEILNGDFKGICFAVF